MSERIIAIPIMPHKAILSSKTVNVDILLTKTKNVDIFKKRKYYLLLTHFQNNNVMPKKLQR